MAWVMQVSRPASAAEGPMIGGWLALLVLLLAAAPLLAHALSTTVRPVPELRLEIDRGGGYALDGRPLGHAALATALRQAQARSPGLRLRIAAADDSDPRVLAGALAVAEQAGVRNIGSELR
jgi:biopolymer transport protein ExbD/biopolymer transport protein TolR